MLRPLLLEHNRFSFEFALHSNFFNKHLLFIALTTDLELPLLFNKRVYVLFSEHEEVVHGNSMQCIERRLKNAGVYHINVRFYLRFCLCIGIGKKQHYQHWESVYSSFCYFLSTLNQSAHHCGTLGFSVMQSPVAVLCLC